MGRLALSVVLVLALSGMAFGQAETTPLPTEVDVFTEPLPDSGSVEVPDRVLEDVVAEPPDFRIFHPKPDITVLEIARILEMMGIGGRAAVIPEDLKRHFEEVEDELPGKKR